jgi:hypothetical protein
MLVLLATVHVLLLLLLATVHVLLLLLLLLPVPLVPYVVHGCEKSKPE